MPMMFSVQVERLQEHLIPQYFVIPDAAKVEAKQCRDGCT